MRYLTDRKRAAGLGSAKSGTAHHWFMTVTSVALLILIPCFIFIFGPILGKPHAEVAAYFSRPFPAVVAALTMVVGFAHLAKGIQTLIEDYVHGALGKYSIILATCLCYALMAFGLFAIVRLAL